MNVNLTGSQVRMPKSITELLDNRPQVIQAAEDEINNPRTRQTVPLPAHMLETTP